MMKNTEEVNLTYNLGDVVQSDTYLEYVELDERLQECQDLEDSVNEKLGDLVPYMDLKMHRVSRFTYELEEAGIIEDGTAMFERMMEYLYDDLLTMESAHNSVERTYSRNSSMFQYCPVNGLDFFELYPIDRRTYDDVCYLTVLGYEATEEQLALINEVLGYKQFPVDRDVLEDYVLYNELEETFFIDTDLIDDTESLIEEVRSELEELDDDYIGHMTVLQEHIYEVKCSQLTLVLEELRYMASVGEEIDLELGKINGLSDELREAMIKFASFF